MVGLAIALGSCIEALTENSVLWMGGVFVGLGLVVRMFWKGLNESHLIRQSSVELGDEPLPVRQLAGTECGVCSKRIVMDQDGYWCPICGATIHRDPCAQSHAATAHGPSGDLGPYRGT